VANELVLITVFLLTTMLNLQLSFSYEWMTSVTCTTATGRGAPADGWGGGGGGGPVGGAGVRRRTMSLGNWDGGVPSGAAGGSPMPRPSSSSSLTLSPPCSSPGRTRTILTTSPRDRAVCEGSTNLSYVINSSSQGSKVEVKWVHFYSTHRPQW